MSDGIVPSWAARRVSRGHSQGVLAAVILRRGSATTVPRRVWGMDLDFRNSSAWAAFSGVTVMTMRDWDSLKRAMSARGRPRDNQVPSDGLRLDGWGLNSIFGIEQNRNQAANSV